MPMTEKHYAYGRFRISAATRELADGDALVELPARAFDCLVYLIEHRDRAVGRDELIAAVWGRADVSEALLNHTILKIRRALGNGGQEAIRTVPRFGYRWVGTIESEGAVAAATTEMAQVDDASGSDRAVPLSGDAPAQVLATRSRVPLFAGALIVLAAIVAVAIFALRREAPTPKTEVVQEATTPEQIAMPALVLPAQIDAPSDWSWLRFGLMDLVAHRLRSGALRTAPSESVVALLKQRTAEDGDALLRDPALAKIATLRVLPRVRLDHDRWIVTLDASGMQRALTVDAQASDPIAAARDASDRLLRKLGHSPGAVNEDDTSPALEDLLQRSGAAMLADQLDGARKLIEDASPALRDAPQVQQRMAQIELRAGEYDAVERRLQTLLDKLAPARDAALRARALITLASSYVRRDQYDKAEEAYTEALKLRDGAQDPEALGVAYLGHGVVLATKGRFDEAVAELGRARIELETAGDPFGVAQVDVNLGDFQVMRHRPADALPVLKNAAQRFEQLGAREGYVYASICVAAVERDLLDPAAALSTTDSFWPPEAKTSNPRMQWQATRARAEALIANGRLNDAQTLIERIRTQSDPKRDAALRAQNEAVAARVAMLRGDAGEAARLAALALALPALKDSDKGLYTRTLLLEGQALRAARQTEQAAAVTRSLRGWAQSSADDWTGFHATLAEAAQNWSEDRRDAALQTFAAAMRAAEQLNVPEEMVAVGGPYTEVLIEVGHIDDARSVSGRIAPWADRDARAAFAQVRLYRALGRADAERNAAAVAVRLVGEGALPAGWMSEARDAAH